MVGRATRGSLRPCFLPSLLLTVTVALPAGGAGYYSGTKGARAGGRAGAFTAKADDLSAVVFNPAGLSHLKTGLLQLSNRFSYNASAFTRKPTLDWSNLEGGVPPYVEFETVRNQEPWQLLDPLLGVASNLGLPDWAFALVAFSPAGAGRVAFPLAGGQRYMMVSREAIILNYSASAAWQQRDTFGVGVSLQWIHVPRLWYSLVIDANQFPGQANPVTSELDMHATTKGSDPFTFNAVLGAWYRPAPFLELGLSGQVIPSQIETESRLGIDPVRPELVGEVVLRRDGEPANDVRVTLPLPVTVRAGVRYRHLQGQRELFDLELDLSYESWSRVEQFSLDSNGIRATLLAQTLDVGHIEVDKRWRDTFSASLGGDYALLPELCTLRAGVFYESAVASRAYANVDFVGGRQLGGTLGASLQFSALELALSYEYRVQPSLSVSERDARVYQEVPGSQCRPPYTASNTCHPQYLGLPAPAVNAGTYTAHTHAASVDALYRF
jgi:long-subunit fatty acid transport protein